MDINKKQLLVALLVSLVLVVGIGFSDLFSGNADRNQAVSYEVVDCYFYRNINSNERVLQVRNQARRSIHGEDMEGHDGPMAKVGMDIAEVYHRYRYNQCTNDDVNMRVEFGGLYSHAVNEAEATIQIAATASTNNGAELEQALKDVGAKDVSRYEHNVSATVPIENIPGLASISEARSIRFIGKATTNTSGGNAITN